MLFIYLNTYARFLLLNTFLTNVIELINPQIRNLELLKCFM